MQVLCVLPVHVISRMFRTELVAISPQATMSPLLLLGVFLPFISATVTLEDHEGKVLVVRVPGDANTRASLVTCRCFRERDLLTRAKRLQRKM